MINKLTTNRFYKTNFKIQNFKVLEAAENRKPDTFIR